VTHVVRALLAAVLGVGSITVAASPAAAAPSFTLSGQTPWTIVDGTVDFDLTIIDAPLDATVSVTVHEAMTSRTAFDNSLEGEDLAGTIHELTVPVGLLPAIGSSERRLTLQLDGAGVPAPDRVPIGEAGVYPVELALTVGGAEPISFVTHLVVVAGDGSAPAIGERLGLSWVWPLAATPELTPDGELAATGAAELGANGRLGRQIAALADSPIPVTIAPGGLTAAQWIALDPPTAPSFLDVLGPPNQVLSSGYVPLDIPALLDAGLDSGVTSGLVAGTASLEATIGARVDTRTTLALDIDGPTLTRLTDANVDRMVVDADDLEPAASDFTPARPFQLSNDNRSVQAAAVDPGLVDLLDGDEAPVLRAQQFLAALSLVASEAPNRARGLVVVNPTSWDPESEFVAAVLAGLDGHPMLEPMTLQAFFDTVPPETDGDVVLDRSLAPRESPATPVDPDAYRDAEARQEAFRSFAGPLSPRLVPGDRALLTSLASTWGPDSADASTQLALVQTSLDAFLEQIKIPVGSTITLTARTGSIPLTFENETGQDVTVRVTLESEKLDFPDGAARNVALPPRASTESFEVETRTSGRFPLVLTVSSPDGELVVSSARVDVRSTAVSGVGVFLTAGAGVVLAGWWANDFRKHRKSRRIARAES